MNTRTKVITIVLVVVLVAIGVIGGLTKGFRQLFWINDEQPEATVPDVFDISGNELKSGQDYPLTAMAFATTTYNSNSAPQGITLIATVLPADAGDKRLKWSAEWTDKTAEWATAKRTEDYLTITPTTDEANKATVVCSQEFGEQITITVTSVSNPKVTANCTADYAERINGLNFKVGDYTLQEIDNIDLEIGKDAQNNYLTGKGGKVNLDLKKSMTSTLRDNYALKIETTLPGFQTAWQAVYHTANSSTYTNYAVSYSLSDFNTKLKNSSVTDFNLYFDRTFISLLKFKYGTSSGSTPQTVTPTSGLSNASISDLKQYLKSVFKLQIKLTYAGTYSTFEKTYTLNLKLANNTVVQNVILDEEEITI